MSPLLIFYYGIKQDFAKQEKPANPNQKDSVWQKPIQA